MSVLTSPYEKAGKSKAKSLIQRFCCGVEHTTIYGSSWAAERRHCDFLDSWASTSAEHVTLLKQAQYKVHSLQSHIISKEKSQLESNETEYWVVGNDATIMAPRQNTRRDFESANDTVRTRFEKQAFWVYVSLLDVEGRKSRACTSNVVRRRDIAVIVGTGGWQQQGSIDKQKLHKIRSMNGILMWF